MGCGHHLLLGQALIYNVQRDELVVGQGHLRQLLFACLAAIGKILEGEDLHVRLRIQILVT